MQRPDQTWTQGKDSFLPSLGLPLDDAWPHGPKDHWLKTTWVSTELKWRRTTTDHTRLWDPKCHQSEKNNRRIFHSTSHQEHHCSTYVISFLEKTCFFIIFSQFSSKKGKKERKKNKKNNDIFVCVFLKFVFFLTISYPLTVLFPSKFKWWYDMSMVWIAGHCLFFS